MHYDNIRPEYFLKKWKYYELARNELDAQTLEDAKVFFHGLKQLSDKERKLLSDIYYKSDQFRSMDQRSGYYLSVKPYNDKAMAIKYHVSMINFRTMRREAQQSLKEAMQRIMQEILSNFVYRMNRHLYLVDIVDQGSGKEQYILGDECDAKKFSNSDGEHEASNLLCLGFERVPQSKKFKENSK